MNKAKLKSALVKSLTDEIETALAAASRAQEDASHEGNKPENKYDTLALEAAYLAHGQSERIVELQRTLIDIEKWQLPTSKTDTVTLGSCVELLSEDDITFIVFIAPVGAQQLIVDGINVQVVNQKTPLAVQLIGKTYEDEVQLTIGGRVQYWEIFSIV